MKTIALNEATWEKLKRIKETEDLGNFNDLIEELIKKAEKIPNSMFGVDKGKSYTLKEHEEFQKDYHE